MGTLSIDDRPVFQSASKALESRAIGRCPPAR